ncbi:MAG: 7-carboxy-7-deazaguanine synthase [Bacteroidia bacterium]|nr:MAG: 7-carboxy-7-deazaguanine synthase [Bacteroidia bacterium]
MNYFSTSYSIMEHFYTIQGEGYWVGTPAYFIRLAGCDVGCHWCDVKESWDKNQHPILSVEEILEHIKKTPTQRIVITGGEPLQQDLTDLCKALHQKDWKIHLETSGVYPLSGEIDWICLSPKKFQKPLSSIYAYVHELKVIIYHVSDFEFAEEHASLCPPSTHLFLQPEWSKESKLLPQIIEYTKQNPQWRISLQTHKYMNIP